MLSNKTILITGATDGIGLQTALELAKLDANLIIHGKNPDKGKTVKEDLISKTKNSKIHYYNADLSSFDEIEHFSNQIVKDFTRLDVLINNAGIYEKKKIILENGLEKTFMVNYLSAFVLTLKLLSLIKKGEDSKIINVSSMVHASSIDFENLNGEKFYSGDSAYSLSKLCNILFTYQLAEVLEKDKIAVNALHPGVINTKLLRAGWGPFGSSTDEGAACILYLVKMKQFVSGYYFENDNQKRSSAISYDKLVMKRLWDYSKNLSQSYFDLF
ncbi:MAG: SDR family oxidoreductase [Bacteroidales bacterium]|nr:SDR family oxidoreductase [Bacteroidales bacterium]